MIPIVLIGFGLSPQDLTSQHLQEIHGADVLVAGRRILAYFDGFQGEKIPVAGDIGPLIQTIQDRAADRTVAVIASGDPLFYGIGARLISDLGPENIRIYPNISSVAAAFARIKIPWQDAEVISLHGRGSGESNCPSKILLAAIQDHQKVAVLTDLTHNPEWIGERLAETKIPNLSMSVLEKLGTEEEKMSWYDPAAVSGRSFASPNLVIILRKENSALPEGEKPLPYLGMPESDFSHQQGLITKAEVRAVSLSKLCLDSPDYTLWDLGAGSGSVAIEASLFLPRGRIYAVERNPERIEDIQKNRSRFFVHQLEPICAELPNGLSDLPAPDRVFIGGGGKDLPRIIEIAAKRLKPGGVMVANTVLIGNIEGAIRAMKGEGLLTETVQIQISRSKTMPWGERLDALNPVWIIQGKKRKDHIQ